MMYRLQRRGEQSMLGSLGQDAKVYDNYQQGPQTVDQPFQNYTLTFLSPLYGGNILPRPSRQLKIQAPQPIAISLISRIAKTSCMGCDSQHTPC